MAEKLKGSVERITFYNDENGYTVLRLRPEQLRLGVARDGTITVVGPAVNPNPTSLEFQVSGDQLTLQWPESHTGWRLQAQTNSLSAGLSDNWVDVTGSTSTNKMSFTVHPINGTVFYRLVYP